MAKFTLLELHLDDSTFTANAPFSNDAAPSDESVDDTTDTDGGRSWLAAFVGLLFLTALAVLVKEKLGEDDET